MPFVFFKTANKINPQSNNNNATLVPVKDDLVALHATVFLREDGNKLLMDYVLIRKQAEAGGCGDEGNDEQGGELGTVRKERRQGCGTRSVEEVEDVLR